ncbi:MAG: hypothetical protein RL199_729 [Pseudomonadota bacterium]|jgi:hypothetical protein
MSKGVETQGSSTSKRTGRTRSPRPVTYTATYVAVGDKDTSDKARAKVVAILAQLLAASPAVEQRSGVKDD